MHQFIYAAAAAYTCTSCLQVDANSIEAICKQKLKLNSEAVLDSDNQQALAVAMTQLQRSYEEAAAQGGDPATLDPVADLKLNQLEIVDAVRDRQRLLQVWTCYFFTFRDTVDIKKKEKREKNHHKKSLGR